MCFLGYHDMPSLDPFSDPPAPAGHPLLPAGFPLAALRLLILHLLRPHHLQLEDKATQPQRVLAAWVTHGREVQARTPRRVGGVLEQSSEASGMKERGSSRPEA